MKQRFFSILIAFCGIAHATLCQVPDTLSLTIDTLPIVAVVDTSGTPPADSSIVQKKPGFLKKLFKEDYPNPNKALLMSVAVPGAGQIYNKRWWKAPIVWAGYGGLIYAIRYNTRYYKEFRDAYILELQGEPHLYSGRFDDGDLKTLRDGFDKNRQKSYVGVLLLHIIQSAEAFVDCHLKTFDVSEDLTLRLEPAFGTTEAGAMYSGIGLRLSIR